MNQDNKRSTGEIDQQIGEKITYFRKNRQMTLQGLADALGITHQQLQKYERATNRVSASRLIDIADALKVPVSEFFVKDHTDLEAKTENQEEALMYYFSQMHCSKQREAMLQLARTIVEK